jgi:hypothetical protein
MTKLVNHLALKTYGEMEVYFHAPDGVKWSASGSGRFTSGVRAPGTHWTEDLVHPRACLNVMTKRKIHIHARNQTPTVQSVGSHYTVRYNPILDFHFR